MKPARCTHCGSTLFSLLPAAGQITWARCAACKEAFDPARPYTPAPIVIIPPTGKA